MKTILRTALLATLLSAGAPSFAGEGDHDRTHVQVMSTQASSIVAININSFRKIGKVLIEVKDKDGRTLYREEGKALTPELVRRLDKTLLPKGELTLHVTARDFRIEQAFTVH